MWRAALHRSCTDPDLRSEYSDEISTLSHCHLHLPLKVSYFNLPWLAAPLLAAAPAHRTAAPARLCPLCPCRCACALTRAASGAHHVSDGVSGSAANQAEKVHQSLCASRCANASCTKRRCDHTEAHDGMPTAERDNGQRFAALRRQHTLRTGPTAVSGPGMCAASLSSPARAVQVSRARRQRRAKATPKERLANNKTSTRAHKSVVTHHRARQLCL